MFRTVCREVCIGNVTRVIIDGVKFKVARQCTHARTEDML
jgi:hypothetical protein